MAGNWKETGNALQLKMMENFGDFAVTATRNMLFVKMFPKYLSRAHAFSDD